MIATAVPAKAKNEIGHELRVTAEGSRVWSESGRELGASVPHLVSGLTPNASYRLSRNNSSGDLPRELATEEAVMKAAVS
jgi:hypothetical protein